MIGSNDWLTFDLSTPFDGWSHATRMEDFTIPVHHTITATWFDMHVSPSPQTLSQIKT